MQALIAVKALAPAAQRACSISRQSSTPLASVPHPLALARARAHAAEKNAQQVKDITLMPCG
jgi:hypothetical protein